MSFQNGVPTSQRTIYIILSSIFQIGKDWCYHSSNFLLQCSHRNFFTTGNMRLNEQSIRQCVEDIKASNVHCLMLIMFLCGNINVKRWGLSFYSKPRKSVSYKPTSTSLISFLSLWLTKQLRTKYRLDLSKDWRHRN